MTPTLIKIKRRIKFTGINSRSTFPSTAIKEALEIHYRFLDYISLLFCEGNPTGVKAAMSLMGKCCPHVRLPLVKASEGLMSSLSQALDKL